MAKLTAILHRFDDGGPPSLAGIRPFAGLPFILIAVEALPANFHGIRFLNPLIIGLMIAAVAWPAVVPAFGTLGRATIGSIVGLMGGALLLEVTVSWFGFGVQPPAPSLGNLMQNAMSDLTVAPWIVIVPTLVTIIVLFALYALGDALAEPSKAGASP